MTGWGTRPRDGEDAVVVVHQLERRFGGVTALSGVNFRVAPGEKVGLIGPNGAGKTTLLNCLTGLERPSRGSVTVLGQSPARLGPHGLARRGVSRSFQSVSLFPSLTPRENVTLAVGAKSATFPYRFGVPLISRRLGDDQQSVVDVLDRAAPPSAADRPSRELPYGTKRRLDLEMALVGSPALLLLDEPSAGLSREERTDVVEAIRRLTKTAVLLTDHDVDVVFAVATRVLVLHEGRILMEGNVEEVRSSEVVQAAYFGRNTTGA